MPRSPNIDPPTTSRLPATRLTISSSAVVRVPVRPREVPMRPYTAARSVFASACAISRTRSAGMPVWRAVASGGYCSTTLRQRSRPRVRLDRRSTSASPSSNITCSSESKNRASVGVIGSQSNSRAVSVRRGSTTVTVPPRLVMARRPSRMRGELITLPCETIGLAPIISRYSTRLMSGMGAATGLP